MSNSSKQIMQCNETSAAKEAMVSDLIRTNILLLTGCTLNQTMIRS